MLLWRQPLKRQIYKYITGLISRKQIVTACNSILKMSPFLIKHCTVSKQKYPASECSCGTFLHEIVSEYFKISVSKFQAWRVPWIPDAAEESPWEPVKERSHQPLAQRIEQSLFQRNQLSWKDHLKESPHKNWFTPLEEEVEAQEESLFGDEASSSSSRHNYYRTCANAILTISCILYQSAPGAFTLLHLE